MGGTIENPVLESEVMELMKKLKMPLRGHVEKLRGHRHGSWRSRWLWHAQMECNIVVVDR